MSVPRPCEGSCYECNTLFVIRWARLRPPLELDLTKLQHLGCMRKVLRDTRAHTTHQMHVCITIVWVSGGDTLTPTAVARVPFRPPQLMAQSSIHGITGALLCMLHLKGGPHF